MLETHIYIGVSSSSPRVSEKYFGYVLECKVGEEIKTREGFGKIEGTYHNAALQAIIAALKRFNQNSEIYVHSEDAFVLNMLELNLERWAQTGFQTSKGKPVANQKEWKTLWELSEKHLILTEAGTHTYSDWIQLELLKRKENEYV